jgi:hypothetical protein
MFAIPLPRTDLDTSGYGAAIARLVTFVRLANKSLDNHLPDIQSTLLLLHLIKIIDWFGIANNTQAVWFTALETGFAIFSLNLPSIWPLVSKVSVESVIRSVRSIASLGSRNSRDKSQTNLSITGRKEHLDSQTDDIELVPRVPGVQNATTADGAWHPTNSSYTHAEGGNVPGIHVQKIVEQRTASRCWHFRGPYPFCYLVSTVLKSKHFTIIPYVPEKHVDYSSCDNHVWLLLGVLLFLI